METKTFCEKAKDCYLETERQNEQRKIDHILSIFPDARYNELIDKWRLCNLTFIREEGYLVYFIDDDICGRRTITSVYQLGRLLIELENMEKYKQNTIWAKFRRRCKNSFGI